MRIKPRLDSASLVPNHMGGFAENKTKEGGMIVEPAQGGAGLREREC